jgi:hypothetical protein
LLWPDGGAEEAVAGAGVAGNGFGFVAGGTKGGADDEGMIGAGNTELGVDIGATAIAGGGEETIGTCGGGVGGGALLAAGSSCDSKGAGGIEGGTSNGLVLFGSGAGGAGGTPSVAGASIRYDRPSCCGASSSLVYSSVNGF